MAPSISIYASSMWRSPYGDSLTPCLTFPSDLGHDKPFVRLRAILRSVNGAMVKRSYRLDECRATSVLVPLHPMSMKPIRSSCIYCDSPLNLFGYHKFLKAIDRGGKTLWNMY